MYDKPANYLLPASMISGLLCVAGLLLLTACSTTQKADINQPTLKCGMLGSDCTRKLIPGAKDQAGLRYVNPKAQWTRYKKIMIQPVEFWGADSSKISSADQQKLVNYFNQQLQQQLGKNFQIVTKPGDDVMKIQAALTDTEASIPGLRATTLLDPNARMLSTLKYLTTGSFPYVGSAQAELKVTDSMSNEVLFEAVDKQIGGGSTKAAFQWQWGDAENAIDTWCEKLTKRLAAITSGTEKP
jgi:Protein of unknown function (DUF3313)